MFKTPLRMQNVIVAILAGLFLAIALMGCGKKGDPVPPRMVLPTGVSDLKAVQVTGNLVLTWTRPAGGVAIEKIRILRSELEIAGDDCPGCPRRFATRADLVPGDARISREGEGRLRFVDSDVKAGWLYTYKVLLCDYYGNCSKDSNLAEAKVKD